MALRVSVSVLEARAKRSFSRRMAVVVAAFSVVLLVISSRLIELQLLRGTAFHEQAQRQHFDGISLPAKRGEILARSSQTDELSVLATNATFDLVYVDPVITDQPVVVAETLADVLVTQDVHRACYEGTAACPQELVAFYPSAFDPLERFKSLLQATPFEPAPQLSLAPMSGSGSSDLIEVRRQFARDIERRIGEKRVVFVPLKYGATKTQMTDVAALHIAGIEVVQDAQLIYGNPEQLNEAALAQHVRALGQILEVDAQSLTQLLRRRQLRYVPVMRHVTPEVSAQLRALQHASAVETQQKRAGYKTAKEKEAIKDPLWSIAFIPEHIRVYPDDTVGAQLLGFLNTNQEAQYGIERTFDSELRGQEGRIRTVIDPQGGQILTSEQRIVDPIDGDTVVLTIDRAIQREVERILAASVDTFRAVSGQVIVMEPKTGRILAMANAPLFSPNNYSDVYEKMPVRIQGDDRQKVVVELYHPETRAFILRAYWPQVFTGSGRLALSAEKREALALVEQQYELPKIVRYYQYDGDNLREEIFPTDDPTVWLKFRNRIGVGAYLNRTIQEIYEPGSVMKSITLAAAIDQGEVLPTDTYDDTGPVKVDEFTIKNALNAYYGKVTLVNCIEFSINTCMTSVSEKLGKKLFHHVLERFGFGHITGVELEDELAGVLQPWRIWSNALLATSSYGQGISATPLQVITSYTPLANGGKLIRPTIVDSVLRSDGTVEKQEPVIVDQVIRPETAATITAVLTSSVENGFAKVAKVKGHRIAGKTGTSQIAGPGGKYETGTGSTIASFIGYAPVDDPKFIILVKFDRPIRDIYGSKTAGPVFRDIAAFLFKYYGIPPDKE